MKIVCDNCATKYSISDDKVRGKMFKIRCKKCSHVIVVRGTEAEAPEGADAASADLDAQKETRVFNYAGSSPPGTSTVDDAPTWHLVIDREQVGPMTTGDVQGRLMRGEIAPDTYVWRDGLPDWLPLHSVPELASALGANGQSQAAYGSTDAEATHRNEAASMVPRANSDDGDGLFQAAPKSGPHRNAYASGESGDLFAASAPHGGHGGSDLFASPAAASSGSEGFSGQDPRVEGNLTGQRHENSVLFSLSNLSALAAGAKPEGGGGAAASAKPGYASTGGNEGSGLIDIRAMAASVVGGAASSQAPSQGGSMTNDDLPSFGMSAFSPVSAPVLMPTASMGMPKWVWGLLAGAGVLLVSLVIMVVILFTRDKPAPVIAAPVVPAQPVPKVAKPSKKIQLAKIDEKKPEDGKETKAAEGEVKDEEKAKPVKAVAAKPRPRDRAESPADVLPRSDQPVAPTKATRGPKAGGDELDKLLNNAIAGGAPPPPSRHAAPAASDDAPAPSRHSSPADDNLPDTLSPRDIQGNMAKVRSRVMSCYDQYNVPGTVFLDLTISPSGRVQNASATGKFSGTPTGECVARAAKGASFPRFKGSAISIQYPFMLSR